MICSELTPCTKTLLILMNRFPVPRFKFKLVHRKSFSTSTSEVPSLEKTLKTIFDIGLLPSESDFRTKIPDIISATKKFPSVTTVMSKTMDEQAFFRLLAWKKKKIKELGEDGFAVLQRDTLSRGSSFHKNIHDFLKTRVPMEESAASLIQSAFFRSARPVLDRVDELILGESPISHPVLRYSGRIDSLLVMDGALTLVEWKTSAKPKLTLSSLYDAPVQAAAYVGALNHDLSFDSIPAIAQTLGLDERLRSIQRALIVVCYEDGSPATLHTLDFAALSRFWRTWQNRQFDYWLKLLAEAETCDT